jgi:hypothetical protein
MIEMKNIGASADTAYYYDKMMMVNNKIIIV